MQIYKYAGMQVRIYAGIQVFRYVGMLVYRNVIMQVCSRYAGFLKFANIYMEICEDANSCKKLVYFLFCSSSQNRLKLFAHTVRLIIFFLQRGIFISTAAQ